MQNAECQMQTLLFTCHSAFRILHFAFCISFQLGLGVSRQRIAVDIQHHRNQMVIPDVA